MIDLISVLEEKNLAPKTIRNVIATLSALFNFAKAPQRRWAASNPCEGVEVPVVPERTEIRFLTLEELDAAVGNVPKGMYQAIDKAMIVTAAMTGLRQGRAGRPSLARHRLGGEDPGPAKLRPQRVGTPKSKRSTRSVPMAGEVGGELERLFKRSGHQGDDDLVFTLTGQPLPKANITGGSERR
jgi:integrase